MREKFLEMTPELYRYMVEHGTRRDEVLEQVERETVELGDIAAMQVAPEQGGFLELLVRTLGVQRAVEVGTFTGYSAICIARGLADGGSLVCCELSDEYADIAQRNLERAGVAERVEIRRGPALETLRALEHDPPVDFAFVDADKPGYADYYEELLPKVRPGGLILLDNVLMDGAVVGRGDTGFTEESVAAMKRLNDALARDERVDCSMIAVADGITLLRRR